MSLDAVRRALEEFACSREGRVIGLSGKWGVGKTHFWKQFLSDCNRLPKPGYYSYVSLFGIGSTEALKDAIFENAVSVDTLGTPRPRYSNTERLLSQVKRAEAGARRMGRILEKVPKLADLGPLLRSAAFMSVREYLVCLDDLERRSETLSLTDVLGLASHLADQRQCRVIVILNSDAIGAADQDDFVQLKEKVFDYDVVFDPSTTECAAIAFPAELVYRDAAVRCAEQLDVKNIRVLTRARRTIDVLLALVPPRQPELLEQIISSSILLTWCAYTKDETAPDFDYVRKLTYASFLDILSNKPIESPRKEWNALLTSYGYTSSDKLDVLLSDTIERGYVDPVHAVAVIEERVANAHDSALAQQLTEAWNVFHSGFGDDESELIEAFDRALTDGAHTISIGNASATISVIRHLGHTERADRLAEHWVRVQAEHHPDALNIDSDVRASDAKDPTLIAMAREAYARYSAETRTLGEVVAELIGKNSWGSDDVQVMIDASEEEYYRYFKALKGPDARAAVQTCLRFGDYVGMTPDYSPIGHKARAALRRIAAESPLNRYRVEIFGINLGDAGGNQDSESDVG